MRPTVTKGRSGVCSPANIKPGVTQIARLGTFSWPEFVALADTLFGALWTSTTLEERTNALCRYEYESLDAPRLEMQIYDCRHDSLRFLGWLIEGWPDSLGANIGRDMLERGLSRSRNRLSHHVTPRWKGHPWGPSPHDFAPETVARLRKLIEADVYAIPGIKEPLRIKGTAPGIKERRQLHESLFEFR